MASSVNNGAKVEHAARLERRRILEQQRAPLQPPPVSQQPQEGQMNVARTRPRTAALGSFGRRTSRDASSHIRLLP